MMSSTFFEVLLMGFWGVRHAIGPERGDEALRTLVDALAHRRDAGGAYRLENEWHYLVARAPD